MLHLPCFLFSEEEILEMKPLGFKLSKHGESETLECGSQYIKKVFTHQAKALQALFQKEPTSADVEFQLVEAYIDMHMMGAKNENFASLAELKLHLAKISNG